MQERIGNVAGKIWVYLGENGPTTVDQLSRGVGEERTVVSMALGWLAREHTKVVFEESDGAKKQLKVCLTPEEQRAFDACCDAAKTSTSKQECHAA